MRFFQWGEAPLLQALLFDSADPAFRCLDAAHLDACKCIVQLLDRRTHLLHTGRECDDLVTVNDLADRGDNCSCAAETALFELAELCEGNVTLLDFEAEIMLCNILKRASCDGRKDCRRTDCDELVALDEDDVGAAGLLDLCACS